MTCTMKEALGMIRKSTAKTENSRYENRIGYIDNKYGFYLLDRELVESKLRKDMELMRHEEGRTIVSGLITLVTLQEKELDEKWEKFLNNVN